MTCILKVKHDAGHNVESAESYNTHVFVVVVVVVVLSCFSFLIL